MIKIYLLSVLIVTGFNGFAQENLSEVLSKYNSESITYISTENLRAQQDEVLILDAREIEEFQVSHLKNAIYVGYDNFNLQATTSSLKDTTKPIVVYCSIGVRSEDIAEQLKDAGYTNIYNLYGGIFEWKNKNLPVYNLKNNSTDSIHAYSKRWGKYLNKGIKVYE
ncbi:rhodanese-like domain-containing protein [Winogradskyella sp. DF17]|uniref:Rhodanese-like domain-containing protein n=1 Tax=Winogradskyella pelagia TaxID=2819984 RepID=A0ABS3T1G1_9FLAO|nr:rhodanese-like domain-containing protein [Winogradskyella sp. DF17]MBO3115706.1 rhodanese-like domain-containing protein [Winogradskyella sp. DF17]